MSKEPWRGSTWHTDCEMIKQQQANNMEDPPNSQLRVGQSHRPGMEEPLVGRRRWQKQLEEDALTGSCSSSSLPSTSTTAASSSSCTHGRCSYSEGSGTRGSNYCEDLRWPRLSVEVRGQLKGATRSHFSLKPRGKFRLR